MKIMAELNPPNMKELPSEIIHFEILPRIPMKFLGRFMCVSKQWRSLLSTPHFARLQLHHQTQHKLLLLDSPRHCFCTLDCEAPNHGSTASRSIPFKADHSDTMVLASLDGLVCVYICKSQELLLWNPLTDGYKKLSNNNHHGFCNIDTDVIGFYKDSSDDYKLLHIVPNGTVLEAYIYSRRHDSWRKIRSLENVQHLSTYRWSSGTFFGESLYFVARDETIESRCHIVVFDVELDLFKELQFPYIPDGAVFCGSLVVLNNHIHLCVSYMITGNDHVHSWIDIWRMDCTSWINVAAFFYVQGIPIALRPVYITSNENWLAIQTDGNRVYKIDWKNSAKECVSFYGGDWVPLFQRVMYVETLMSPNP